jgi:uncharacterized membrane protein YgcG
VRVVSCRVVSCRVCVVSCRVVSCRVCVVCVCRVLTWLLPPFTHQTHLAEAPESYQSTTPGTDPFLSTGSDTAMKPVRLSYAHPHGNHEDGNNAHAGANSSKDPPNRDVRDQSQSQSSVKTTPHPRSATTSANTTTASSGGGGSSTGTGRSGSTTDSAASCLVLGGGKGRSFSFVVPHTRVVLWSQV